VLRVHFPCCAAWQPQLRDLFARYVEAKQAQSVLDYDDRLLYWAQMVGDSELATEIDGMFDHVLVDEYQDTDRLQASILLALKPDGRGLTVVGDDAQSIYSFRAATVRNIGTTVGNSEAEPLRDRVPPPPRAPRPARRQAGRLRRARGAEGRHHQGPRRDLRRQDSLRTTAHTPRPGTRSFYETALDGPRSYCHGSGNIWSHRCRTVAARECVM
jgi:hypothetical protein